MDYSFAFAGSGKIVLVQLLRRHLDHARFAALVGAVFFSLQTAAGLVVLVGTHIDPLLVIGSIEETEIIFGFRNQIGRILVGPAL